jgi:hypothetical protein
MDVAVTERHRHEADVLHSPRFHVCQQPGVASKHSPLPMQHHGTICPVHCGWETSQPVSTACNNLTCSTVQTFNRC